MLLMLLLHQLRHLLLLLLQLLLLLMLKQLPGLHRLVVALPAILTAHHRLRLRRRLRIVMLLLGRCKLLQLAACSSTSADLHLQRL